MTFSVKERNGRRLKNYVKRVTYLPAVFYDLPESVTSVLKVDQLRCSALQVVYLGEEGKLTDTPGHKAALGTPLTPENPVIYSEISCPYIAGKL